MKVQAIAKKLERPLKAHKGTFGRIFLLAGSRGMTGAAHLAGMAALRAGAGLVTVGIPDAIYLMLTKRESELMIRPYPSTKAGTLSLKAFEEIRRFASGQDVFGIGPGLSQEATTQRLIRKIMETSEIPIVIDADGINALKGHTALLKKRRAPSVLTPHPGEFLRAFAGSLDDSEGLRKKRALEVAKKFSVVLLLKGHHTVIASPEGDVYRNETGNPGMATAGSGDVLTGMICALLGQGLSPFEAACFGAYVHGLAGDLAAKQMGQVSMIAGDLLQLLPQAFKSVVGS